MSSYWKAVLGVILVFVLGCMAGWLGASVVHYRQASSLIKGGPEAMADLLERRMTRNLDLDPRQKEQIHDLFETSIRQRKQLQLQIQPQVQALNRETYRQILAVLRPDQVQRLHENIHRFQQGFGKGVFNPNVEEQTAPPPHSGTP